MENNRVSPHQIIAAGQLGKEKEYWHTQLSGDLEKSTINYEFNRKEAGGKVFNRQEIITGPDLSHKLLSLSNGSHPRLHMILLAGLEVMLSRYSGKQDILVGAPIYKEDRGEDVVNTVLILRNKLEDITFKQLLLQIRQSLVEAIEHVNYPLDILLEEMGLESKEEEDFPLFDVSLALENIHDSGSIDHIHHNLKFTMREDNGVVEGVLVYNGLHYSPEGAKTIARRFVFILETLLKNIDIPCSQVELILPEEKALLLGQFNRSGDLSQRPSVYELFKASTQSKPGHIAISAPFDKDRIFNDTSCLAKNPFLHESGFSFSLPGRENAHSFNYIMVKTPYHNCLIINQNLWHLLDCFDGKRDMGSIYRGIKNISGVNFVFYRVDPLDMLEITYDFTTPPEKYNIGNTGEFSDLVQQLYKLRLLHWSEALEPDKEELIEILPGVDFIEDEFLPGMAPLRDYILNVTQVPQAQVLLLGDTPGMPSTGLLYLASFLKRNGTSALCRFYDNSSDYHTLKKDIEQLLKRVKPQVVAVSMKWFPYMERVLEICKIVKEFSRSQGVSVKTVVGGNTASYYGNHFVENQYIDYIVRGDGEQPLLDICKGKKHIVNGLYKRKDKVIDNTVSYLKSQENSPEVFLSDLEEIVLSPQATRFGSFFIYTHLGCNMNCFYCGGCRQAQEKAFNRRGVFIRPIEQVRKDIEAAMSHVSTFQFDFESAPQEVLEYCRMAWEDIDLINHYCIISSQRPPSEEFIRLASETFRYVYWDLDVLTLSQRHRLALLDKGMVKPQPRDEEITAFLSHCDHYKNTEVRINLITGLPLFEEEDNQRASRFLTLIMDNHPSFSQLHWARLHAQPGAPLLENANAFGMHSFAVTYEDFLSFSQKNFPGQSARHDLEFLNYPYIYYENETLNSSVTLQYSETNRMVKRYYEKRMGGTRQVESLTYQQLQNRVNSLAGNLRTLGVRLNDLVGILLSPSVHIPVAILGILKTGAAYLPIDPQYPDERIKYMLGDSGCGVMVTAGDLSQRASSIDPTVKVIDLTNPDAILTTTTSGEDREVKSGDPVYTIYTSGTTGKPKGVMLTHGNLTNYVEWFSGKINLNPGDNALLTSSFAFDLGYTSIYPPLLKGASLHIVPRELYLVAEQLLEYIKDMQISYLKVTPSLFSVMIQSASFTSSNCHSLGVIVLGGEAIRPDDVEKASRILENTLFMNHYGPTEATIGCIAVILDMNNFNSFKELPVIGKPIDNTGVFILGNDLELLPPGVPGELCISGACLGRGYLNRPQLSSERFLENPFFPGERLYRTGDLARRLSDGNIEFLGRIDTQVKIRGYRVELKEIERQLEGHKDVKECLVTDLKNKEGEMFLCAYVIPNQIDRKEDHQAMDSKTLTAGELEVAGLPIPQFIEHLASTPNEKPAVLSVDGPTFGELDQRSDQLAALIKEKYSTRFYLSPQEKERYKRQMLLDQWGTGAQEILKNKTAFVAGAGGGASPTLTQLALAGFGTLVVCDFDEVELSNLNRQFLHDDSRLGINKAISAQMTINRLNPHVKVIPITEMITGDNVSRLVGDSDFIFDMLDDLDGKFTLSRCAAEKGIPHIVAAMTELSSYVAIFHTPHTPCFHCLFDKKKFDALNSELRKMDKNYNKKPLHVVASSLFVSTGFAVTEAIKIALGMDNPAYNKYFLFNQKASPRIAATDGYGMMTFAYSEHFRTLSEAQGFPWEQGWNGNFLVELDIHSDPNCVLCSNLDKLSPQVGIEEKYKESQEKDPESPPHRVFTLLDKPVNRALAALGVFKTGKILVPASIFAERDRLEEVLNICESRLILAETDTLELAREIRDKVNKNIEIIEIENPGDPIEGTPKPVFSDILNPTALIYQFDPAGEEDSFSAKALKEFLGHELPDYMVPTSFVELETIPLTPNGKVDRRALPEPQMGGGADYRPPRDEIDVKIIEIWEDILGVEQGKIGLGHNFFEMGGNSLSLIQLVSRIYKEFDTEVSITQVFENPYVSNIAALVKSKQYVEEPFVALNEIRERSVFCFPPAVGFGMVYKGLAGAIDNHTLYSFNFIEDLDRLEKYVNMIDNLQPQGNLILFGFSAAGRLAFEVTGALEKRGRVVSDIIFADCFWNPKEGGVGEEEMERFIETIEKQLQAWDMGFAVNKVSGKIRAYEEYFSENESPNKISAQVHVILSEESRERKRKPGWDKLTRKKVKIYDGFGGHAQMLFPGPLEGNAQVVKSILESAGQ